MRLRNRWCGGGGWGVRLREWEWEWGGRGRNLALTLTLTSLQTHRRVRVIVRLKCEGTVGAVDPRAPAQQLAAFLMLCVRPFEFVLMRYRVQCGGGGGGFINCFSRF